MVTKTIEIQVIDGDVTKATDDVQKLDTSIKKVEGSTKKVGNDLGSSFDKAGQSADNLSGGVRGVATELGTVTKAAKVGGKAMRTALISTGIGALVVALGLIVEHWDTIAKTLGIITSSFEEQIDLINSRQDALSAEISILDKQSKLLELQGKSNEHLQKQKVELLKKQKALNESEVKLLENQILRLKTANLELSTWEKIKFQAALALGGVNAVANSLTNDALDREKALADLEQQLLKAKGAAVDLNIELFKTENPDANKADKREKVDVLDSDLQTVEDETSEFQKQSSLFEDLFSLKESQQQQLIDLNKKGLEAIENDETVSAENRAQQETANAQARVRIAEEEAKAKIKLLGEIGNGLNAASDLLGQSTAAGKATAVAAALISTYAAIAGQLQAFAKVPIPGYAIAQAIATGISGFAAVKNILSVKVPNSGSGGLGGNSAGSVPTATAPSFNVVGTSGVNQLAESLNQEQEPIQAYVVGSQVTTQQQADRNILDVATIG